MLVYNNKTYLFDIIEDKQYNLYNYGSDYYVGKNTHTYSFLAYNPTYLKAIFEILNNDYNEKLFTTPRRPILLCEDVKLPDYIKWNSHGGKLLWNNSSVGLTKIANNLSASEVENLVKF